MRTRAYLLALSCAVAFASASSAQTPEEKQATVAYLQSLRSPSGGYTLIRARPGDGSKPELRPTSGVIRSIGKFGGKLADPAAEAKFVLSCFDDRTGGFAPTPGGIPAVDATAVGLMACAELNLPDLQKVRGPAVKYLATESRTMEDVRIALAATEAINEKFPTSAAWLRAIYEQRRSDGTWGLGPTAPRATATFITMTMRMGAAAQKQEEVIKVMRTGQRPDGGYADGSQDGSDLESTYRVMRALTMLKSGPVEPAQMRAFIGRCRNADGGYGLQPSRPSNASGVYYAGYILGWLDDLDRNAKKP
ncbi:MAG: hypothetical protein K1X57_18400 [Gemmataceae bacterium]|nr:hypothetical protein [Gemmataceae bacterium]